MNEDDNRAKNAWLAFLNLDSNSSRRELRESGISEEIIMGSLPYGLGDFVVGLSPYIQKEGLRKLTQSAPWKQLANEMQHLNQKLPPELQDLEKADYSAFVGTNNFYWLRDELGKNIPVPNGDGRNFSALYLIHEAFWHMSHLHKSKLEELAYPSFLYFMQWVLPNLLKESERKSAS